MSRDREELVRAVLSDLLFLRRRVFGQRGGPRPDGGVAPAQGIALHMIANAGDLGIRRIAELMGVSRSAVTQFVDSLVGAGLLTRETDPGDRRSVRLSLTGEGRRAADELQRRQFDGASRLLSPLSDEELRTFKALLGKITCGQPR